jgi:hypothetical protein
MTQNSHNPKNRTQHVAPSAASTTNATSASSDTASSDASSNGAMLSGGLSGGLPRRRFLVFGAAGTLGTLFANAGHAFGATKKKKVVVKPTTKPSATKVASATPTVPTATGASASAAGAADPAKNGASFSETQELAITFAFVNTAGGGRFHNPFVAVWIEDANEALVRNVSLNYELGKGSRWLHDLTRWYGVYNRNATALGADRVQEVSGPTRIPGTYSLVWDGRDEAKNLVPHGTYYVCVEAAVEKGSYQLMREAIQLTGAPVAKSPADNGDLQRAKFELRARK